MTNDPFNRCGLASLDDLATPLWRSLFSRFEAIQNEFLVSQPHCPDYSWPRDPLHNCIRVWEYPFVYHHIQSQDGLLSRHRLPEVVDLGSGATFFPFAVARLGCRVLAVDADPRAQSSLDRAAASVPTGAGAVISLLSDARSIALGSESVDCVYCISVLEHIPDFERVVAEASRILRRDGLLILTFDIDLCGNGEIGPAEFQRLTSALDEFFEPVYPERVIHPRRILTSQNSLYPIRTARDPLRACLREAARALYYRLGSRPIPEQPLASTYGACLRKRHSSGRSARPLPNEIQSARPLSLRCND